MLHFVKINKERWATQGFVTVKLKRNKKWPLPGTEQFLQ